MDETMIFAMVLCVGIAIVGYAMKTWPVVFVSSAGWIIVVLRWFEETQDFLIVALVMTLAIGQVFLVQQKEV